MRRETDVRPNKPVTGRVDLWGFLAFSHVWTWLFWGILIASDLPMWESPTAIALFTLGGIGVPAGGIVMTWRTAGSSGLRDLGNRLTDLRRIGWKWWSLILLAYPLVKLTAGILTLTLNGTPEAFDVRETIELVRNPLEFVSYLGFVFLLGPLPEEIGWRGYLLDRLQIRTGPLGASILVGLIWFTWHLPLFFMEGYYAAAGGPPDPVQFGVSIVLGSILYTWIYNHTGRSVLGAVLFHYSGNLSGELLGTSPLVYTYETYLTAALVLIVLWGGIDDLSSS